MKINLRHEEIINLKGDYKYILSYSKGDILPNGEILKKPKVLVMCNYCKKKLIKRLCDIEIYKCSHCCGSYENSFAYHIEVELGEPLEKYWDFEKNTVNPYHIWKSSGSNKIGKVWIKCVNEDKNKSNGIRKKDYHGSYEIACNQFVRGRRCPYCSSHKIHLYDSFGYNHFEKICMNWHPDNEISPFKTSIGSKKKGKFICYECNNIWTSLISNISKDRWCSKCKKSKGEKRILKWLVKNNINYELEKSFDGLVGIGNHFLRFDFYIPNCNLLIEYQGGFHDGNITGSYKNSFNLNRQQEHDRRKRKYAKENNIKLLEIWYWDFENIEEILKTQLEHN